MGKNKDLTVFQRGMIVGARLAGATARKTAELVGCAKSSVIRVFQEWEKDEKTSANRNKTGRKSKLTEEDAQRLEDIIKCNNHQTTSQLTNSYNQGSSQPISARTMRRILKKMEYKCRSSTHKPLISKINKRKSLERKANTTMTLTPIPITCKPLELCTERLVEQHENLMRPTLHYFVPTEAYGSHMTEPTC